jgi:hypothetical protein
MLNGNCRATQPASVLRFVSIDLLAHLYKGTCVYCML